MKSILGSNFQLLSAQKQFWLVIDHDRNIMFTDILIRFGQNWITTTEVRDYKNQ